MNLKRFVFCVFMIFPLILIVLAQFRNPEFILTEPLVETSGVLIRNTSSTSILHDLGEYSSNVFSSIINPYVDEFLTEHYSRQMTEFEVIIINYSTMFMIISFIFLLIEILFFPIVFFEKFFTKERKKL